MRSRGGGLAVSQLQVQPRSFFSIQWAAEMNFAGMIGGMGTLGGILGTVIFFVLQQNLAQDGVWYLIIFGTVGRAAIWTPRGSWGAARQRTGIELFSVGYRENGIPGRDGAIGTRWERLRSRM